MDAKLTKIYYSPKGYWKGMAAIKKLANAAKVSEDEAKQSQHEIMNLRILNSCVKNRKYDAHSLRTNCALRKDA